MKFFPNAHLSQPMHCDEISQMHIMHGEKYAKAQKQCNSTNTLLCNAMLWKYIVLVQASVLLSPVTEQLDTMLFAFITNLFNA